MAGLFGGVSNSSGNNTGTSAKTILQYTAPANGGAKLTRFSVGLKGIDPAGQQGIFELVKGASSGTGTSVTVQKSHGHTGSIQGTAKEEFSAEPTGGTVLYRDTIHPQGKVNIPRDIILNPGETLGIRVTMPASVGYGATMNVEE